MAFIMLGIWLRTFAILVLFQRLAILAIVSTMHVRFNGQLLQILYCQPAVI